MKNIAPIIQVTLSIFYFISAPENLAASDRENSMFGRTTFYQMDNAPYPDTSRAEGFIRGNDIYPPEIHYSDPSVAVFIPGHFRTENDINLLFYFHGHNNNVRKSLEKFDLRQMVAESERNVILVFPQGPKDSRDSGCGKLEVENGFKNLVIEVLDSLKADGVINQSFVNRILLSGHSGAYLVIGQILKQGGLTDIIKEVYLLDATYAQLVIFENWVSDDPGVRLRSIFTDHLAPENVTLMKNLSRRNVPYKLLAEEVVVAGDLENRILFLHAVNLTHGETVGWLGRFLGSSTLKHYAD